MSTITQTRRPSSSAAPATTYQAWVASSAKQPMVLETGHKATVTGTGGKDLDVKAGREAAHTAALNVLALAKKQLGSLDRVSRVVRLGVYVAATPQFTEHAKVADSASELLRDVLGEETVSSRLVFGIASLPLGSPVELELILEVKPGSER